MLLLSVLWFAVLQALAPQPAPVAPGAVGRPSGVPGVAAQAAWDQSVPSRARPEKERETGLRGSGQGDREFCPPETQRLSSFDRTCDRSGGGAQRSPVASALASAHFAMPPLRVSRLAAYRVSPAATSRGGHLTYYSTAPPIAG